MRTEWVQIHFAEFQSPPLKKTSCSWKIKIRLFTKRGKSFPLIPQDFPSGTSRVKSVNLVLYWTADDANRTFGQSQGNKISWDLNFAPVWYRTQMLYMGTGGCWFQHGPKNTYNISQDWNVLHQKDMCLLYWEGFFVWFWAWILRLAHVAYVEVESFGGATRISETHPCIQTNSTLNVSVIWS